MGTAVVMVRDSKDKEELMQQHPVSFLSDPNKHLENLSINASS